MKEIADADLTHQDIPPPGAEWGAIGSFALTFDGYAHWGSFEKCAEVANNCEEAWKDKRSLPHSLTDLRTCLFFEQRRWQHFGYEPDGEAVIYLHALVEAIRSRVQNRGAGG